MRPFNGDATTARSNRRRKRQVRCGCGAAAILQKIPRELISPFPPVRGRSATGEGELATGACLRLSYLAICAVSVPNVGAERWTRVRGTELVWLDR